MIYLTLFIEFFKVGLFCFGGAFGMIPLIEEIVLKYGWLTESEFYNFIGVCESTPGPIAVNMATYIGSAQGGILGSVVATLGVITPSFIIILLIASLLKNLTQNKYFKGFLKGVQPVIIALILSTGTILLAKVVGYTSISKFSVDVISVIVFLLISAVFFISKRVFKKKISSVTIIILSAFLGLGVSLIAEYISFY